MIGSAGISGPHPLVYLGQRNDPDNVLSWPYLRTAVQQELEEASEKAKAVLSKHRAVLAKVAEHLLKYRRIDGEQVAGLLTVKGGKRRVNIVNGDKEYEP